jgi:hypothetical protein
MTTFAVYSLSGTIWFNSVFTTGLYANFFGILAMLLFIAAFLAVADKIRSWEAWGVFFLGLVMLYFSHFSSATLFPALIIVPFAKMIEKRSDVMRYAIPTVIALFPAIVGYLAFSSFANGVLNLAAGGPALVVGGTPLSSALASVPLLSFMALETSDDVAFVILLVLLGVYVFRCVKDKQSQLFVPLAWILAIATVSVFATLPTRLAFSALLPFEMAAGFGLASVLPKAPGPLTLKRRRKGATRRWHNLKTIVVLLVLLVPVVVNSWGQFAVGDSTTSTDDYAGAQRQVYTAMYWLKDNTPQNSTYLSVTDWRFEYTKLFFNRTGNVDAISGSRAILFAARQQRDNYLIVTFFTTVGSSGSQLYSPWNAIQDSANFTLVYSNPDVKVFKLRY